MIHNIADLRKGPSKYFTPLNQKNAGYTNKSSKDQNYLPIFWNDKKKPEAFFLNAKGEPVLWLEKIGGGAKLARGLCYKHQYGGRIDLNRHASDGHDLNKILPGTWEAEEIECKDGYKKAAVNKTPSRWMFTSDGVAFGSIGHNKNVQRFNYAWHDPKTKECTIDLWGVSAAPDKYKKFKTYMKNGSSSRAFRKKFGIRRPGHRNIELSLDKPGAPGWRVLTGKFLRRGGASCTYRAKKISPDIKYAELNVSDRQLLDGFRKKQQPVPARNSAPAGNRAL